MNPKRKLHGRERNYKGHVDICFDETGSTIATCASDGEAKVFTSLHDQNPIVFRVDDAAHAVGIANNRLYVAGDDNSIQCYKLEDSSLDGILLRFTTHINHFCFNKRRDILVAGAGDFMVKTINLKTSSQTDFKGHTAPVLSVAIHPDDRIIASSSCDGSVRIWQCGSGKCLKMLSCLPKSNDVGASKTLARICFTPDGKYLLVPTLDKVSAYDAQKWTNAFDLTPNISVVMPLSLLSFSSCGKFIAGASTDGWIFVWNFKEKKVIKREKHDKKVSLTALVWKPHSNDILYCDESGHVMMSTDVVANTTSADAESSQKTHDDGGKVLAGGDGQTAEDLFGDDDDDADLLEAEEKAFNADNGSTVDDNDADDGGIPGIDIDGEDDNDDDVETGKKKMTGVLEDDDDNDWSKKLEELPMGSLAAPATAPEQVATKWEPAGLQKAFQPSSSPVGLTSRFMVWNDVGRVHQYDGDEDDGEKTINVEFHDTSFHHALHVDNSVHNFTMAALSTDALVLACEADGEVSSQLKCMHFGSWDSNKEWTCSMPENEDICGICLGEGWLAVATDRRVVRLFTVGGVQKQIFCVPGPVVAVAAKLDLLVVIYHDGMGVPGDQCLSFKVLSVLKRNTLSTGRLSISAKTTLAWIGFSSEGSLFSVDSSGQVRMLNRGFADTWIPVCNLKEQCKGLSDNYWVVSIRENPQQIRAIFCKGSRYPPTLPLPIVQILPFKLPLCEANNDKSQLEEQYWRTLLFSEHFKFWKMQGYEFEEADELKMTSMLKEILMRQFALACRGKRDVRAVEVCEMMPDLRTIQLAIKYASQKGDVVVAERLNDLAQMKVEEEQKELEQQEQIGAHCLSLEPGIIRKFGSRAEDVDHGDSLSQEDRCIALKPAKIISTSSSSSQGRTLKCQLNGQNSKKKASMKTFQPSVFDETANDAPNSDDQHSSEECVLEESCDDTTNQTSKSNSLLTWKPGGGNALRTPSLMNSQTTKMLKNPFKVVSGDSNSASERSALMPRGTNVFDRMEKPSSSRSSLPASFLNSTSNAEERGGQRKRKRKDQQDCQDNSQKEDKGTKKPKMSNQKLTGFMFSKNSQ